jgi:hypothetical protein
MVLHLRVNKASNLAMVHSQNLSRLFIRKVFLKVAHGLAG